MISKESLQAAVRSPRTKKYGWRVLIVLALFTIVGFFVLPPIAKSVLVDKLGTALHRPVAIKAIKINPYELTATVEEFEVREPDGAESFVGFDSLYVNVAANSIFRGAPVVQEIRLVNPRFKAVRRKDGRYNFSDLVDEFLNQPESKDEGPPPLFSLNNIQISGGTVEFDDRLLDEQHAVNDIQLAIPFVSNMAYATHSFVEPAFSANIDGAPLSVKGRSKPFADSLESEFALDLKNFPLGKFLDYSPVRLALTVASGTLDTDLKLVFRQEHEKASTLMLSGTLGVEDLAVRESSGAPLVSLKRLTANVRSADLLNRKFVLDRVAIDSPEISTRVSKPGLLNWSQILLQELPAGKRASPSETPSPADKAPPPLEWSLGEATVSGGRLHWLDESNSQPVKVDIEGFEAKLKDLDGQGKVKATADFSFRADAGVFLKVDKYSVTGAEFNLVKREVEVGEISVNGVRSLLRRGKNGEIEWLKPPALRAVVKAGKEAREEATAGPWMIKLNKISGDGLAFQFEDSAVAPPVTQNVEGLSFELNGLSSDLAQPARLKARFKLNRKGEVTAEGTVRPLPLQADLTLDMKSVELLPLQSYFTDKLNISLTRGQLSTNGALQLSRKEGGAFTGRFDGQLTLGDFRVEDKLNAADLLRWKSLHFGKIELALDPVSVSIGEIALSDFFSRLIVSPEGKLNLLQIVRQDERAAAAGEPPPVATEEGKSSVPVAEKGKPVLPVKIGKITLQGGNIRFSDNFVKPNYTANLKQIGGRVSGLSSEPGSVADLELRGSYDNVAPLELKAKINPLSAKPYLDLQANVKGMELTPFSTYSGKYAGYAIEKGKLSLTVSYKIENGKLEAENHVFLDQLTFGGKVDSPDATHLPVELAVSLLKNRNGEIDLNLPISGSLDDPQFSVGSLVVKVIVNLLTKALTSPFALIGSMFGNGGEEMATVEFDYGLARLTPESEKRLENLGKALLDRPALKLEIAGRADPENDPEGLKRARLERKLRALKREELAARDGVDAKNVELSPEEYPVLLERVYKAEKFPKPRNAIGLVKSLPVEEMEKLIFTHSVVDEENLTALADRRAKLVRDWLIEHEVPAERLFLLPSKLGGGGAAPSAEKKLKDSRVDFSLK